MASSGPRLDQDVLADVQAIDSISPHPRPASPPTERDPVENRAGTRDASSGPSQPAAKAWLQVAASFALYFNHLGLLNSFGAFQAYYESHLLSASSPSAISWIGSLQVFCLMALGVLAGPLFDLGHARSLLVVGTVLLALGFVLTSLSTRYWHVLLAQGLCMGAGACCLSVPSIAVVPLYFPRDRGHRALAMGVACVGSGLGSTLYPLVFQRLQAELGFPWAVRAMGLIALVMCVFATLVLRPPGHHSPTTTTTTTSSSSSSRITSLSSFWDASALRDRTYLLFCAATFFSNLAFFNPPYYLQPYALAHGMARNRLAPYLLAILNASSIPGRILPSLAADRAGPLPAFIAVLLLSSASVFYWLGAASSPARIIAFAALYGFFSGGVVALGPVVLAAVTRDLSRLGTRLGMLSVLKGVGSLLGPPISGALLDATGGFLGIQLFAGCSTLLAGVLALVLLVLLARGHLTNAADQDNRSVDANDSSEVPVDTPCAKE